MRYLHYLTKMAISLIHTDNRRNVCCDGQHRLSPSRKRYIHVTYFNINGDANWGNVVVAESFVSIIVTLPGITLPSSFLKTDSNDIWSAYSTTLTASNVCFKIRSSRGFLCCNSKSCAGRVTILIWQKSKCHQCSENTCQLNKKKNHVGYRLIHLLILAKLLHAVCWGAAKCAFCHTTTCDKEPVYIIYTAVIGDASINL